MKDQEFMKDQEIIGIFNNENAKCDYCNKNGRISEMLLIPKYQFKNGKHEVTDFLIASKCAECKKQQVEKMEKSTENTRKIFSVRQLANRYEFLTENTIRWIIYKNEPGLEDCLIRISRRIYIDEDKFLEFLDEKSIETKNKRGL
jgi:hypothetical protein